MSRPTIDPTDPRQLFFRQVLDESTSFATARTASLFVQTANETQKAGSAMVLQIGHTYLLLTAAHALSGVRSIPDACMFIGPYGGGDGVNLVTTKNISSPPPIPVAACDDDDCDNNDDSDSDDEPLDMLDVEIGQLATTTVEQLNGRLEFLKLRDLAYHHIDSDDSAFLVCGYPKQYSRVSHTISYATSGAYSFLAPLYTETTSINRYDGTKNLAVRYDRDTVSNVVQVEDGVERDAAPSQWLGKNVKEDIGGISGCGIWRVGQGVEKFAWSKECIKLAAIEHHWKTSVDVAVGTRIRYVVDLIYDGWPELRGIIDRDLRGGDPPPFIFINR